MLPVQDSHWNRWPEQDTRGNQQPGKLIRAEVQCSTHMQCPGLCLQDRPFCLAGFLTSRRYHGCSNQSHNWNPIWLCSSTSPSPLCNVYMMTTLNHVHACVCACAFHLLYCCAAAKMSLHFLGYDNKKLLTPTSHLTKVSTIELSTDSAWSIDHLQTSADFHKIAT